MIGSKSTVMKEDRYFFLHVWTANLWQFTQRAQRDIQFEGNIKRGDEAEKVDLKAATIGSFDINKPLMDKALPELSPE